jgi:hypothetical protein
VQLPLTLAAAIQRLNAGVKRQANAKCLLSRSSFGTFELFCDLSCIRLPSSERPQRAQVCRRPRASLGSFFHDVSSPKLFV